MSSSRWTAGDLTTAGLCLGVAGFAMGIEASSVMQNIQAAGFWNALFGAELGLLGLDWPRALGSGLLGAAPGGALIGVAGALHARDWAAARLARRREGSSEPSSGMPRKPKL